MEPVKTLKSISEALSTTRRYSFSIIASIRLSLELLSSMMPRLPLYTTMMVTSTLGYSARIGRRLLPLGFAFPKTRQVGKVVKTLSLWKTTS
jgi:hypothetical protein